jgi:hypothetical protein
MFISALFTIIELWKQPRCPTTDKWINENVIFTHKGILFSHKEK